MISTVKRAKIYDLANSKDQFVRTGTKRDAKRLGLFTRSVHVLLENSQGQILVCRRPKSKQHYPSQITSSAGGHVERGENYRRAAGRELKEELGISIPIQDIGRFDVVNRAERAIHHLFLGKAKRVVPDSREIISYRFVEPRALARDVKNNPWKYAFPFQKALDVYLKTKEDLLWIVDFDHTLFDWYRFRDDLGRHLERTLKITISQFKAAKDQAKSLGRLYSFDRHMRELARLSGVSYARIHKTERVFCQRLPKYIFPDSFKFLRFAQKNGRVIILTYGDEKNQKFFIKGTEIRKHCANIIVVPSQRGKCLWLNKVLRQSHRVIFINDSPVETELILQQSSRPWKIILVERPSAKHPHIPRNKNYIVVRDLAKIPILIAGAKK